MIRRGLALARKALRRHPRYVLGRLQREVARQSRRPWDRIRPRRLTDRVLLDKTGAPSIDVLWQRLRSMPFFVTTDNREIWTEAFGRAFPDGTSKVVAAAEAVLRHEFDLLGSGSVRLGDRLPWHVDFKTGREWPMKWGHDFEPNELDLPSDIKVPWELSRCQHFTTLGQAWWLTRDPRYAREFVAELDDWIARNPYGYGVNWVCPMDVALRGINWMWGFHFFSDAPACASDAFRSRLLRGLWLHGEFVAANPEMDEVNGNHYLVDAVGLVCLGLFFKGTSDGERWLHTGRRMVLEEIAAQTHEDGTGIEQSTAYHRLVLEAFLTAGLLLRAHGDPLDRRFWDRVERMHEFIRACAKPDGQAPLFGDADDGRIQKLGPQAITDYRYLLSIGAVIFGRGDFKHTAGRLWEESFWLLGPSAIAVYDALETPSAPPPPQAFPQGGFYVLRNPAAHLIVDCGEVGMKGLGGHGHNDILSFDLSLDGSSLIADSGSYLYTASRDWRNRFRSTAFHNTLQVDGEELNRFVHADDLWRLRYDAVPRDVRWSVGREWQCLRAGHRGYERLSAPVTHLRTFLLHQWEPWVIVADRLEGAGSHRLVWRFHLDPSVHAEVLDGAVTLKRADRAAWLTLISATVSLRLRLEEGWYSRRYGEKIPRTVVVADAHEAVPFDCVWSVTSRPLGVSDRTVCLSALREHA